MRKLLGNLLGIGTVALALIGGRLETTAFADRDIACRGCCSHHNGVCGCQGGRAKCCDGTLSPTCGCD